jgi:hypothetical protein
MRKVYEKQKKESINEIINTKANKNINLRYKKDLLYLLIDYNNSIFKRGKRKFNI